MLKEINKIFDDEESHIYNNFRSNMGKIKADNMFLFGYEDSKLPSSVALKRIRSVRKKVEKCLRSQKS